MFNHVVFVHTKFMNKLKRSISSHTCHFASKAQLNSETNLYCCKDLKVTKNAGKFRCCYCMYQGSVGERDTHILLHIYYITGVANRSVDRRVSAGRLRLILHCIERSLKFFFNQYSFFLHSMTFSTCDFIIDLSIANSRHFLVDPSRRQVDHPCTTYHAMTVFFAVRFCTFLQYII